VAAPFVALGTDGFGRSAARADLRAFFEVDRKSIALAAIDAAVRAGRAEARLHPEALERLGLSAEAPAPWTV
jgi:pyruvate dehydrogenase E1 component